MRTGQIFHAGLCLVAVVSSLARAVAEDAAPAADAVARPGIEESATPPQKPADAARESDAREAMCLMIESAARAENLPLEFFARVIWQESRFQSDAVGPVTRGGQRAQGIAQFMPGTASERRLLDPFDPVQALPKSAEFLNELRNQFGNLGLAAAAYNAGPRGDQDPSLLSSVMRGRGTRAFYQVRIGADTRPEADTLCNRIRKAGGACFVLRNMGVRG